MCCLPPCHSLVIGTFPCVFLARPVGMLTAIHPWLPPNTPAAHCTPAIHHLRIWGESSSEHLVIFSDFPADLLALCYAWGNVKMFLIFVENHIRNRRTSGTACQHQACFISQCGRLSVDECCSCESRRPSNSAAHPGAVQNIQLRSNSGSSAF